MLELEILEISRVFSVYRWLIAKYIYIHELKLLKTGAWLVELL